MSKHSSCAGIILAGGLNSRMAGRNKARLPIEGQTILDRLVVLFRAFFDPIMIVTNQPRDYLDEGVILVTDLVDIRSSLTGIYSGLFYSPRPHAFITGCDMPFLKQELLELMLKNLEARWDVVVPVTEEGYQAPVGDLFPAVFGTHSRPVGRGEVKGFPFFFQGENQKGPRNQFEAGGSGIEILF